MFGHLFSKTINGLPEKEKEWVLLNTGFKEIKVKDGKVVYRYKSCVDQFPYTVEHEGKRVTVNLKEKRLLPYNPTLAAKYNFKNLTGNEILRSGI